MRGRLRTALHAVAKCNLIPAYESDETCIKCLHSTRQCGRRGIWGRGGTRTSERVGDVDVENGSPYSKCSW